jgi:hypothetical protein
MKCRDNYEKFTDINSGEKNEESFPGTLLKTTNDVRLSDKRDSNQQQYRCSSLESDEQT